MQLIGSHLKKIQENFLVFVLSVRSFFCLKFFGKELSIYMCTHKAKACAYIYALCQNMRTHIYASCTHVVTWNFTNIVLIVHYYVMTLSFKFGKDPSFWCRDICKIMLSMHARGINACAHFQFVCMHMCTDLYQNFYGGTLLYHELSFKFHRSNVPLQNWAVRFF